MDNRFDGFAVNLYLDDEGAWLAHFVELPEVSAFGDTPEAALNELACAWNATKATYLDGWCRYAGARTSGHLTSALTGITIAHWRSKPRAGVSLTLSWRGSVRATRPLMGFPRRIANRSPIRCGHVILTRINPIRMTL
jgi:predicted RNase H-like HicB family nuclease